MSYLGTPSADQLAAARVSHWRHNADPILTINMLRDWLNTSGLVLFTPRHAQLPTPAPSFVEATLGAPNPAPTLAEIEQSRTLLSRLILDGGAIPLNLLGNPTGIGTETPDFLVSPLAFPYIFTLRGDKAWKQPPTTSGATKVSPLALNTYTLLANQPIGLSASDLATQLGKEVTETAVLRALTELWQHLRVLPVPQPDGAPTLWELTTNRFTKQIKAGANAGQPTALSALISLYLRQALVASEEEIEIFLSPIAARSRVRDVIHALLSARQLETITVEGRTVLHIAGEPPTFLVIAVPAHDDIDFLVVTTEGSTPQPDEASPRIKKFIPAPRKVGTGFVTKSDRSPENRPRPQERRPFNRESNRLSSQKDRTPFTRPWAEEKAARLAAAQSPSRGREDEDTASSPKTLRPYDSKPSTDRAGKRPPFGSKPSFGSKPGFGSKPRFDSNRSSFKSDRPFRRNEGSSDSRPPRREFTPRSYKDRIADDATGRPRTFSKPGTFGRKREGFAGNSSFARGSDSRPPRRDFEDSRPPRREFAPRLDRGDTRPPRRTFGERPAKPSFGGPRKPGSFSPRPQRSFDSGDASRKTFSRGSSEGRANRTGGPPFRKFDAPRSPRPFRDKGDSPAKSGSTSREKKPFSKSSQGLPGKPGSSFSKKSGSFAGKKPFSKSAKGAAGKPASTFDKFKGNKKPFGKRPPARKFKPKKDE